MTDRSSSTPSSEGHVRDVTAEGVATAPVLFLAFNRPDLLARLIDRLRGVSPRPVFVLIDGPRPGHPEDDARCAEVREVAEATEWASMIHVKAEPKNLGCARAVPSAIPWALDQVSVDVYRGVGAVVSSPGA